MPGSLRVVAGEELLRTWEPPGGGSPKVFCFVCGSALWSRKPQNPDELSVRMGSFDEDPGVRPSSRQFVAYAAAWEPIPHDGLPHYPEARPPDA